jgi:predicted transcriptional regulator of viral defense system
VSHETALTLFDLTEILPERVHLTVPPGFRKATPSGCVLHKAVLAPGDVEEREGFRVTTPLRTLLDAAASGVSREQLEKAATDALSRGLVSRARFAAAAQGSPRFHRLTSAPSSRRITKK